MREFDINKIGKKMPYKAPSEEFFDKFTEDLISKAQPKPRLRLIRRFAPIAGVAAMLAIAVTITFRTVESKSANEALVSENIDNSIDSYLTSLSDDELNNLYAEGSYQDDFYYNLLEE